VSVLLKEWTFRMTRAVGKRIRSPVLVANAHHHRSDALSSVVAMVGIGGAMLGAPILDPVGGFCVALMIAVAGVEVATEALTQLTDAVDDAMIERISRLVQDTAGVVDQADLRVRWSGRKLLVDVSVVTDPTISVSAASDVTERVRYNVQSQVPAAHEVLVHSAPRSVGAPPSCPLALKHRPTREAVERDVARVMDSSFKESVEVEHITVHYLGYQTAVEVAIKLDENLLVREAKELAAECREVILRDVPDVEMADIHLDLLEESPQRMVEEARAEERAGPGRAEAEGEARGDGSEADLTGISLQGPLKRER